MPPRIIKTNGSLRQAYAPFDRGELCAAQAAPDTDAQRAATLDDTRCGADQRIQEAYAGDSRRGEEGGNAASLEDVAEAVFKSAAESIRLARVEFLASLEHAVVTLARSAAERVLRRELRHTDMNLVTETVRAAIREMNEREHLVLHLNPADITALEVHGVDLTKLMSDVPGFEIVGDETVTSGGCVVNSESLQIDAQLEQQLTRIFNAISI